IPLNYYRMAQWALGQRSYSTHAAPGGANFMSVESLFRAVVGGLERGENGRGYLVGDENLHFADFFGLFFAAAGKPISFDIRNEPWQVMADTVPYAGRSSPLFYAPEGARELDYPQHDLQRTVGDIVAAVRAATAR